MRSRILLVSHGASLEWTVTTLKDMLCLAMTVKYFGKDQYIHQLFLWSRLANRYWTVNYIFHYLVIIVIYCCLEGNFFRYTVL